MKEFTITQNDAGQRLDRWLAKAVPLLPASLAQKYIRLKRIKLNGKRAERDTRLTAGDTLQLYINDEFFDTPKEENAYLTVAAPKLHIVYEDENLLLVDKKPGQAVHPHDGAEYGKTLIDHIQAYLYANREWRPREEHAFAPALCNRIDRNTGGIVIAAKNAEALRILNQKIKDREIDKRYLCIVHGTPRPASGRLEGQLFKDAKENRDSAINMKQEYEARLAAAREEADGLVRNAVQTAQRKGDAIVAEANSQASHLKQKAEQEIAQEKKQMLQDVRGEISDIAVSIASKVVEREVKKQDYDGFVDEFIKNVGEQQ